MQKRLPQFSLAIMFAMTAFFAAFFYFAVYGSRTHALLVLVVGWMLWDRFVRRKYKGQDAEPGPVRITERLLGMAWGTVNGALAGGLFWIFLLIVLQVQSGFIASCVIGAIIGGIAGMIVPRIVLKFFIPLPLP